MRSHEEIKERFKDILDLRFGSLECGDGWNDIIWDALEQIEKHVEDSDECRIPIIKEKFGTLRIQTFMGTKEIWDIIDKVERLSETTCEACGSSEGKMRNNGWLVTRCDKCFKDN
jgi:hypothetical protein